MYKNITLLLFFITITNFITTQPNEKICKELAKDFDKALYYAMHDGEPIEKIEDFILKRLVENKCDISNIQRRSAYNSERKKN